MSSSDLRARLDELAAPLMASTGDAVADARTLGDLLDALGEVATSATLARYQAVARLRQAGMSISDIGEALGVARGTAQRLVERARDITSSP